MCIRFEDFLFVAFWTTILLWPGFIFLNYFGIEIFEVPSVITILFLIILAVMGVILNWIVMWGIASTSPLFVRSCKYMSFPQQILIFLSMKVRCSPYLLL